MEVEVNSGSVENEIGKDILESSGNNPTVARIVIESIAEEISRVEGTVSAESRERSARTELLYNLQKKEPNLNTVHEELEEEDYEENQEDRKQPSKEDYRTLSKQVDKFKLLGHNSKGWPIYRVTDIYYAADPYTERLYEDKIQYYIRNERPRKVKDSREEAYNQIIERWLNRENDEFNEQDKDDMDEEELKEIVADMGEKRENFFLYYKNFPQAADKYFQPMEVEYSPLNSCDFAENFNKAVLRRKQQYRNIEEFEEERSGVLREFDEKDKEKDKKKLWGGTSAQSVNKLLPIKTNIFTVQDELMNPNSSNAPTLTTCILREHSYINSDVINETYNLPLEQLQRIEIDLSNPNFFLKKVNLGVAKRSEELYRRTEELCRKPETKVNAISNDNARRVDQSVISDSSRNTGGPTVSLKPISDTNMIIESTGMESLDNLIFEKAKLQSQKKAVIKHSDVATMLNFAKFTLEIRDFVQYHRYAYPWRKHDQIQLEVSLVKAKPAKSKGEFLQLNIEKQESNVKFSSFKSLSLASGDFISVENIEESPLIMSNIGMCTKMYLQVNPKAVFDKMQTDIYKEREFEELEEAREKTPANDQSLNENCARWRRTISESLGPNGKLYIGSESSSLLIGSPQGIGVTVMESNLVALPVVKQKPNPRDFILVREGGNWYLRRTENVYTSGQIEPKMEVFLPQSRNINNFKQNFFKSYAKKRFQQTSNVHIDEFKDLFHEMNEHNIRKHLKEIGARSKDNKHFMGSEDKDLDFDVTPEQICQYEKMQNSLYNLQSLGIGKLKTPDKLKQTITTLFKEHPEDLTKFALSKFISDELQLTSWYLSESFLNAEQGQSKIELYGLGDPTNNHGGYSYIKKPQKERVEKEEQIDKKVDKKVSGTAFDLRKLKTEEIDRLLLERGKKPEQFMHLGRWPKINMLKKIGGDEYQRPERHDKKKKKEAEKREISAIFNRMIKNLGPEAEIQNVDINKPDEITLADYVARERPNWLIRRDKLFNKDKEDESANDNDEGEENDEE